MKAAPKLAIINKSAALDPMPDQLQHFYQAIAQPKTSAGGAGAKAKAGVKSKGAIAQMEKSGKKKGLLDGVRLK
jgi:hypothetical protein